MEELIEYLKNKFQISNELEMAIRGNCKEKKVSKGVVVLAEESTVENHFFIVKGCFRSYCTDNNGNEKNIQFAIDNQWISDYTALYDNLKSNLSIESLCPTIYIEVSSSALKKLYEVDSTVEKIRLSNIEESVNIFNNRVLAQLKFDAKERYNIFLKEHPFIENYVPNYHIASYLGITPESLSRIRLGRVKK